MLLSEKVDSTEITLAVYRICRQETCKHGYVEALMIK